MSYLIISDIHGSYQRLEEVLETPYNFDSIILVGDLMYHGPRNPILEDYNPAKVADVLNSINKPIIAVRGNCDSEVDQMLLKFPMMQDYTVLYNGTKSIFLTHGHIVDPKDAHTTHSDIFISGHTHLPGFTQNETTLCINPGSISLPKGDHPNTYTILKEEGVTIYSLDHKEYLSINL